MIIDLVRALSNWSSSKENKRKGRKVWFHKFKSRRRDHANVRFITVAMSFWSYRRTIIVPVFGALCSKENTKRVESYLSKGNIHLLSIILSKRLGRLFVSANCALRTKGISPRQVPEEARSKGRDRPWPLRDLAAVSDTESDIMIFYNHVPLRARLAERLAMGRQLSRRIPGSFGHLAAKIKFARLDADACALVLGGAPPTNSLAGGYLRRERGRGLRHCRYEI